MEITELRIYLLQTIVCLFLTQRPVDAYRENIRPGRHVCTRQEHVQVPIHARLSYLRPVYRRHTKYCQDDPTRICTEYRLEYQRAFKSVFRMDVQMRNKMTCCPGWTHDSPSDPTCMKPICIKPCRNEGECIEPDRCECREGWTGKTCGQDVNECMTGSDDCHQKCINTKGSFYCECYDGFRSIPDMNTCELCLSCSKEYQSLLSGYATMAEKVVKLEKEKDLLMQNMSTVQNDMHFMADQMHRYTETTQAASTPTTTTPITSPLYDIEQYGGYSPIERIASLSEQISMLEERLDVCTCESKK